MKRGGKTKTTKGNHSCPWKNHTSKAVDVSRKDVQPRKIFDLQNESKNYLQGRCALEVHHKGASTQQALHILDVDTESEQAKCKRPINPLPLVIRRQLVRTPVLSHYVTIAVPLFCINERRPCVKETPV